jgi:hypothetical protein
MQRQKATSILQQFPSTLAYVVHVDSWLALGTLALVLGLLQWLGTFPGAMAKLAFPTARLIWFAYFFLVARKAALGKKRLPIPSDYLDAWDTLIQPLLQVGLATSWYWGGVLIFLHYRVGLQDFIERYQAHPLFLLSQQGILGYLVLGVGIFFVPLSLLGALCCRRGILHSLDPTVGFRLAQRVSQHYIQLFLMVSFLGGVGLIMDFFGTVLETTLLIPLASPVIGQLPRLWVPLAQARLLGSFVYLHKAELTLGEEN